MNKFFLWLINPPTDGPKSILLLRLMAGAVFFWEGLLKFVYVNQGVGTVLPSWGYRFRISQPPSSGTLRSSEGCSCFPGF